MKKLLGLLLVFGLVVAIGCSPGTTKSTKTSPPPDTGHKDTGPAITPPTEKKDTGKAAPAETKKDTGKAPETKKETKKEG